MPLTDCSFYWLCCSFYELPTCSPNKLESQPSCIPSWFGGLSLVFPWHSFRAPYSCFTHFIAISCLFWPHLLIFSPWSSSFAQPSNAGVSQGWDFDFLFCFFCANYTGKTLLAQNSSHHLCAMTPQLTSLSWLFLLNSRPIIPSAQGLSYLDDP